MAPKVFDRFREDAINVIYAAQEEAVRRSQDPGASWVQLKPFILLFGAIFFTNVFWHIAALQLNLPGLPQIPFSKLACPCLDVGMNLATLGRMNMKTKAISAKSGWWFQLMGPGTLICCDVQVGSCLALLVA